MYFLYNMSGESDLVELKNQQCPVCGKNEAVFSEYEVEDPYAGPIAIFSIRCESCGFRSSDLEFLEPAGPAEYSIEIEGKEDLDIRVVKSGECEVKIPNFRISVDSTMGGESYISNVEGVLQRFRNQIEMVKNDMELDKSQRNTAKTTLKNIDKVLKGEKKITLKMKDKSGNSAIISDKAAVKKIKGK